MSKTSLALYNLRGFVILVLVAFHSSFAYLAYNPTPQPRYYPPPLISDSHRWIGFDLFCASQYIYVMQLMFLLSGLFVWSSLQRRGKARFLYGRFWRLGVPFLVGALLMMPLAHYPIYRLNTVHPSWSGFFTEWLALPFWPTGHLWFLWCLLVVDIVAVALCALTPNGIQYLGRISGSSKERPSRYFLVLLCASAIAYVPLSLVFRPWEWILFGPFGFQPSFALLYAVYFFAGMGIGVFDLDRGLLDTGGRLAQRWMIWLAGAIAAFPLWIIPTALTAEGDFGASAALQTAAGLGFVAASTAACFAIIAVFLRFGARPSTALAVLSDNAYGIYFFHFGFVLWLQYMLLDAPLYAFVKLAIVAGGTLALSWAASAGTRALFAGPVLMLPKRLYSR
jgi:hypothetical protein